MTAEFLFKDLALYLTEVPALIKNDWAKVEPLVFYILNNLIEGQPCVPDFALLNW